MINTAVYGVNGKMGQILARLITEVPGYNLVFGVDKDPTKHNNPFPVYENPFDFNGDVDVIIDFSHHSNLDTLLEYGTKKKIPLVIATTGYKDEQIQKLKRAAKTIPILYSPNMSFGINIINNILRQYSEILSEGSDIEIIEKHHNKKVDAPSGTAYLLANTINKALDNQMEFNYGRMGNDCLRNPKEIGIHTVRAGSIFGEHTVMFASGHEIIEIKHTALSKELFALDAIRACNFMVTQPVGFYTMDDIFITK